METINQIAKIREKLDIYSKPYIEVSMIQKILDKFAPSYSIKDLCNKWLLTPIKRGAWYLNNRSREVANPFVIGGLYMWESLYTFGGMCVYNRYSLSEQIATRYTIYNTLISWEREIAWVRYIFIRQRESFFYGIKSESLGEYIYSIMTIERAVIEMMREDKVFRSLPFGVSPLSLIKLAEQYASQKIQNTIKELCTTAI